MILVGFPLFAALWQYQPGPHDPNPPINLENPTPTVYTITVAVAAVSLGGQDAALKAARVLSADSGSLSLGGQDAALNASRVLSADSGSLALGGQDAALKAARVLSADSGSLALSGQDAALKASRVLSADSGSLALGGQDAALKAARVLSADSGSLALGGQDAALKAARVLSADSGSLALSGQDAALKASRVLSAGAGAFTLTGQDVVLTGSGFSAAGPQNLGLMVRGRFDSGDFALFTGLGTIVLDGITYFGGGTALQIGEVAENTGTEAAAMSVTLSGIDPEVIALAEAEQFQRRRVDILLALFDDQGQLTATDLFFSGLADDMDSDDNPAAPRVSLNCEARVLDLRRPRPFKYLPEDQKRRFPGDTFFDLVQAIQNREDTWGQ